MTRPRRPMARWFAPGLAIGLAALISGCGGIFSDTPHRPLYQLKPAVNFGAPMRPIAAQLLVALPTAPTGLDTARVALSRASMSLDYFADAEWADSAPIIVQSALVDAFEKSGAVPAVGRDNAGLRADFILETELRDFTAVYDSPNSPPRATVALTLKLIKIPERKIVAQQRVIRQQPAAGTTIPDIVNAFNAALSGTVEEAVRWAVGIPALLSSRPSVS